MTDSYFGEDSCDQVNLKDFDFPLAAFIIHQVITARNALTFPELCQAVHFEFPEITAFWGSEELLDQKTPRIVYWVNMDRHLKETLVTLLNGQALRLAPVMDFVYHLHGFDCPYPTMMCPTLPDDGRKYWCPVLIEPGFTSRKFLAGA